MRNILLILSCVILSAACTPPKPATPATSVVRYSAEAEFDNVRDDLQNAIIAKGLVIDNTSHIAKMLERTGKDVGSTKSVFTEDRGQAFSFCSATISRKTMEADAHNIAFCPYSLTVYSTVAEPKKVYVAYRRPVLIEGSEAAKASLKEVEMLLDGIARDALHLKDKAK
jgi:uncharacterized protein (DUF302 family)